MSWRVALHAFNQSVSNETRRAPRSCSRKPRTITSQMPKLSGFIPLFALGEVALFSINAVANAATMWTVPLRLRSLACALVTITIHVLGDVPAPPIVGKIQDNLNRARGSDPNNWRTSLSVIVCALLVAVVLFGAGAWVSRRCARPPAWGLLWCSRACRLLFRRSFLSVRV